jgi:TetR/AcrR family transcriptional repressor of lmrAB and yxaGH operons
VASDTRDRLIRTTSRLLRTQGYGATGLNQVMAEADAPKGSMYFHFPGGKEELAAAAIDRFAAAVSRGIAKGLETHDTVADAIAAFFDQEIARLERTEFAEGCAVATVALDAAASHDLLATTTGDAFRSWTTQLSEALEAEGRSAEEARRAAILFLAAFEGALVMAKAQRSIEPMVAMRDVVHDLLGRG